MSGKTPEKPIKLRADKWLWHARFFKTRSLATAQVAGGHLRVNGDKVAKASHALTVGDVLTFVQGRRVRVVKVLALSERRGPASEAQMLYEDMSPEAPPRHRNPGAERKGRPNAKERRNAARFGPGSGGNDTGGA